MFWYVAIQQTAHYKQSNPKQGCNYSENELSLCTTPTDPYYGRKKDQSYDGNCDGVPAQHGR